MDPIVPGLIVIALAENLLPLIIGLTRTPQTHVFLGATHYASDYFLYLSQVSQGAWRNFTTINFYTTENLPPTIVGWPNVVIGKIFSLFNTTPTIAYHLSVIILMVTFLYLIYWLGRRLTGQKFVGHLTLFLFIVFNSFPLWYQGKIVYQDYYSSLSIPGNRLDSVPHHLLTGIILLLVIFQALIWPKFNSLFKFIFKSFLMILTGAVIASLQPVQWMVAGLSLALFDLSQIWRLKMRNPTDIFHLILPGLLFFLGGLPVAIYIQNLFTTLPFVQSALWEALQQASFDLRGFILSFGPVMVAAILLLPVYFKKINTGRMLIFIYTLVSFILLVSPLPPAFKITNVRFLSTLSIFGLCFICASALNDLKELRFGKVILIGTLVMIFGITLPSHIVQIQKKLAQDYNNAYFYLPKSEYAVLLEAHAISTPNDNFLVAWPFDVPFAGLVGRREYAGHPLFTIDAKTKEEYINNFFSKKMSPELMQKLLIDNQIKYVIGYSWSLDVVNLPFLLPVYGKDSLVIYRVI